MSGTGKWLSVVTVIKDAPEDFARTVESLTLQTDSDFEFVVIDSSADSSVVKQSSSQLPCSYLWSQPHGIYSAMNLGLATASGDYIYFLNAGDELHAPNVLEQVRRTLETREPGWAFGPVQIVRGDGSATVTPEWDYQRHRETLFAGGHFPPHQGTFVKRDLLNSIGGFDTSYRIAADYAAFLFLSQQSDPIELPFVIANFTEGGTSTRQWLDSFKEFHAARRRTFAPTGLKSLREYASTMKQIVAVGLYRNVWTKVHRS